MDDKSKKSTELDVDGKRYLCSKYPARYAVRLLSKLSKILAKPLGMVALLESSQDEFKGKVDILGNAIDALMEHVDPDTFDKLILEILEGTTFFDNGKNRPIIFDTDFQGELLHLMKLLKEVLAFQYGHFLADGAAGLPSLAALSKTGKIRAL